MSVSYSTTVLEKKTKTKLSDTESLSK